MRKENILTYNDTETIMLALMGRAMDEREAAEKARNKGDAQYGEYHEAQENECRRVIEKIRAYVF